MTISKQLKKAVFLVVLLAFLLTPVLPARAETVYPVQPGDTLYRISLRFGVSVQALRQANGITGNLIFAGQQLVIPVGSAPSSPTGGSTTGSPTAGTYTVQRGDTLWRIATRNSLTVAALKSANGLRSDLIYVGQVLIIPGTKPAATPAPVPTTTAFVPKQVLEVKGALESLWSADGKLLVVKTATGLVLYDVPAFSLRRSITASFSGSTPVAISSDSRWLAFAGQDNSIQLWDTSSGQLLATLTGHTAKVLSLAFSPDSRTLATLGFVGMSGSAPFRVEMRIWSVSDGKQLLSREVGAATSTGSVYFLENRVPLTNLVVGDACSRGFSSTLASWPLDSWFAGSTNPTPIWQRSYSDAVVDLTVNTGTQYIAGVLGSAACVGTRGAMIWNGKNGDEVLHLTEPAASTAGIYAGVAAEPKSPVFTITLINGSSAKLHVYSSSSGQETKSYSGEIGADSMMALASNGVLANSINGMVTLWNINTGERGASFLAQSEMVSLAGFSPDGHWLITQTTGSIPITYHIWQVQP
jgi:LysM repeat protein